MYTITVLLFANLREKAGFKEIRIDIEEGATIQDLVTKLIELKPILRPHFTEKIIISINHQIATRADIIPDSAEVAFLPPAGGG